MLLLSLGSLLALCACDRDRERRESTPAETRTRSGELAREPRRIEPQRVDRAPAEPATAPVAEPTTADAAPAPATDPRFDAGRLSIIGSADEVARNLGIVAADGGAVVAAPPPIAAPPSPAEPEEPPAPPTHREGAGRPGAGGDPYE